MMTYKLKPSTLLLGFLLVVLMLLTGLAFNWAAVQASFSGDDAHLLQLANALPFWRFFTQPESYQLLSVAHFTPLVPLLYQMGLGLGAMNPAAFLFIQTLLFGLTLGGLLWFMQRWFKQLKAPPAAVWVAGLAFGLAVVSIGSLPSLLLRNYTMHYLLGGVFAVLLLHSLLNSLLFLRKGLTAPLLTAGCFFLAILSKEIYLPLFGLIFLVAVYKRQWFLLTLTLVALGGYFALRGWHLGVSTQGRNGVSFLSDLLNLNRNQLYAFASEYARHHWGLLVLSALALAFNPRRFVFYAFFAGLLLTPLLAAPHGFTQPEFHADRLLYPFNMGMAVAIALALGQALNGVRVNLKSQIVFSPLPRALLSVVLFLLILSAVLMQIGAGRAVFPTFEAQERQQVRQLLQQLPSLPTDQPFTLLIPFNFKMAALVGAFPNIAVTANCFAALQQKGDLIPLAFKGWVARSRVEEQCQPLDNGAALLQVQQPVNFSQGGVLSWQATSQLQGENVQAGVYFPKRALFIGTLVFNERLVRPYPNEEYQWVIKHGNAWWFSERNGVRVE